MKKQEIITDKQARALIDEHFEIVSESVKVKKNTKGYLQRMGVSDKRDLQNRMFNS